MHKACSCLKSLIRIQQLLWLHQHFWSHSGKATLIHYYGLCDEHFLPSRLSGKFRAGVQHDAQELLNHLLTDTLANCPRVRFVSLSDQMASVTALFEGKLAFQTQCFDCDHLTRRTEPFIHVTVPVTCQGLPGFPPPAQNQCYTNSAASAVSISWCLSRLLSRERLTEENKFWCENCQHLVEAERSTLFASLPNVLTLHLNRFSVQEWGRSVHKVSGSVAVPMSLCLKLWSTRDCVASDSVYLLQAIVLHTGVSCNSGHYTAIVRQGRQWLHCDDETVTVMSEAAVLELLLPFPLSSATPYILFYCNSLL